MALMCGKKSNIACRHEMNAQAKVLKNITQNCKNCFSPSSYTFRVPFKWIDSTKIVWKAEKQRYIESKDVNYCLG